MEATGNYSAAIADFLYNLGYEVNVVNPFCIKSYAKSKLTIHKTDTVDAKLIAEYASQNDLIPFNMACSGEVSMAIFRKSFISNS
jgi:transposase